MNLVHFKNMIGIEKIGDKLEMKNLLKKINEIDKLKMILLSKDQILLFD